jgi:hypothetical protein
MKSGKKLDFQSLFAMASSLIALGEGKKQLNKLLDIWKKHKKTEIIILQEQKLSFL